MTIEAILPLTPTPLNTTPTNETHNTQIPATSIPLAARSSKLAKKKNNI